MQLPNTPPPAGANKSSHAASDAAAPSRPLAALERARAARARLTGAERRDLEKLPLDVLFAAAITGDYYDDGTLIAGFLRSMEVDFECVADAKSSDRAGPADVSVDWLRHQEERLRIVAELYRRERVEGGAKRGLRPDDRPTEPAPPPGPHPRPLRTGKPFSKPVDDAALEQARETLTGDAILEGRRDDPDGEEIEVSAFHAWAQAHGLPVAEAWGELASHPEARETAPRPTIDDILGALAWPRELVGAAKYVTLTEDDATTLLFRAYELASLEGRDRRLGREAAR